MKLLEFTDEGIFCEQAGVYIDPWKPVRKAILTHAHSDHARWGSQNYLCHRDSVPLVRHRLGDVGVEGAEYSETFYINGVKFSFHPAGHIIGSAQIRVEKDGEVWTASGDYKLENDGLCRPFESVKCHVFVTESTFGLPVYQWEPQEVIFNKINEWWRQNAAEKNQRLVWIFRWQSPTNIAKRRPFHRPGPHARRYRQYQQNAY